MQIKKIGHCCLVIKDQGLTVLTDPGAFSTGQNDLTGIDVVLITHEHQDHFHLESLKAVLANNPGAVVVTNSAVGSLLDKEHISHEILEQGQSKTFGQVLIEAFGDIHADIFRTIEPVQNTGYLIGNKLFYPGDAFTNPAKPVEILALPVSGPWMKISEALDYALVLKPKIVFPVHDGFLKFGGPFYSVPKMILEPKGVRFIEPDESGNVTIG